MKEKYTTLQNFSNLMFLHIINLCPADKSLRMNNTKGLDKKNYENDEEFYLDEDFEKEDSSMSIILYWSNNLHCI